MNKSNHSTASMNETSARIRACQSGRNPCRLEELRARMHAEQAGKTPVLPWGQWRPSSQCASKIRSVLAAFETIGKLFAVVLTLTLTCGVHGAPANTVPGRLLVKPRDGVNEASLQQLFASHGAQQHAAINQINVRILNVPEAARDHVLVALQHNPNIEFAEPDGIHEPSLVPNDTYYSFAWHLPKIQAPQAWDITTGSSSVIIAILDTGVESTHPDLAAKIVSGWNFYDNNSNTSDVLGHGTQVAGGAAAISNNGAGVSSLAWGCRIMPIRVSDATGSAFDSTIAQALSWAADQGVRVANASYAVSQSSAVAGAAQYFQSKGGVVTIAAGNQTTFVTAADNPYVLTISATDSSDQVCTWSNTGNNIDLAAPGSGIPSTGSGGTYVTAGGTSLSAPIVAGVAALVISANPSLTGAQAQDILKKSADDLGAPGWDPSYGWGRVNAYKAVLAAIGGSTSDSTSPTALITSPSPGTTVSGTVAIGVSATDNVGVTKVECYINGALTATSTTTPATFSWDTKLYANGSYTLLVKAYDTAGNVGTSAPQSVSVQNTVADVTAPTTATITAPASGGTVSGVVSVNVSASDNVSVTGVEWYLDGVLAGSSATTTSVFSWNTAEYPNGPCTLQARAYDAAGNVGASTIVNVTVQNTAADTTPPSVQITSPTSGATLLKTTKVYVTAGDNVGVTRVDLLVDGKLNTTSSSSTPVFSWNTMKVARGSHTLQAFAYDAAGNSTGSPLVTVNK